MALTLGSHIHVPARDDADDEPYQVKVWVTLNRATIAEIGRSLAMRRRSIARLTVLLADVDSNRKLAARIERVINRTLRECADLDELVQSAVAYGAGPDHVLGQVRVHSTHGKPQPSKKGTHHTVRPQQVSSAAARRRQANAGDHPL